MNIRCSGQIYDPKKPSPFNRPTYAELVLCDKRNLCERYVNRANMAGAAFVKQSIPCGIFVEMKGGE